MNRHDLDLKCEMAPPCLFAPQFKLSEEFESDSYVTSLNIPNPKCGTVSLKRFSLTADNVEIEDMEKQSLDLTVDL